MLNLIIFASGNGSTFQSIIDSINNKDLNAKVHLLVSNNPNAYALERARLNGISTYLIKNTDFSSIDDELSTLFKQYSIDLIVLAGYLKKIGPKLIKNYKIINTHPSLLPKFGGKGMYGMHVHEAVINAKEKQSGVTLHFVNDKYDDGDIIAQTVVDVLDSDNKESLAIKVQTAEKLQLIRELKKFENKINN